LKEHLPANVSQILRQNQKRLTHLFRFFVLKEACSMKAPGNKTLSSPEGSPAAPSAAFRFRVPF
jgi:hypothetical protein